MTPGHSIKHIGILGLFARRAKGADGQAVSQSPPRAIRLTDAMGVQIRMKLRALKGQPIQATFFGLQVRTTVLLAGVVLVATALTGETSLRLSEEIVQDQTSRQASDLARALATAGSRAVQHDDRARLLGIAQDVISNDDVAYIIFTDLSGRWLACNQRGAGAIDSSLFRDREHFSVEPINCPRLIENEKSGPCIDVVYPVVAADEIVGAPGLRPTVGFVRIGLTLKAAQRAVSSMKRNIIGLSMGIALLMVPLSYQIVRRLVLPLNKMSRAAAALASGELTMQVPDDRADEIGDLARAFNKMADQLIISHHQLTEQSRELERRVTDRTRKLQEANQLLSELASRDSLTGLYNRRHFNEVLGQLFAESTRYQSDLTCMMIDLDNLKCVNDTLGHQTGDRLISLTAKAIAGSVRESDVAVRYGGDEFAVLLPRTMPDDARRSAERLLSRFREDVAREMPEASVASLSIGLASREKDQPATAQSLLHLADEALYLAKAGGKDRITVVRPAEGLCT